MTTTKIGTFVTHMATTNFLVQQNKRWYRVLELKWHASPLFLDLDARVVQESRWRPWSASRQFIRLRLADLPEDIRTEIETVNERATQFLVAERRHQTRPAPVTQATEEKKVKVVISRRWHAPFALLWTCLRHPLSGAVIYLQAEEATNATR